MSDQPFYSMGLRFSCTRCSTCCCKESGFVYLSENDLFRLANEFQMDYAAFIKTWCRWIPFDRGRERLSLKEKSNYDCIFWSSKGGIASSEGFSGGGGCTVYEARPLQCRVFPFWDSTLCSEQAWEAAGTGCPGINNGELFEKGTIEAYLRQVDEEPVIEREIPHLGGS